MRILLAGTSSGCGKTTASLLLMAALRERGLDVSALARSGRITSTRAFTSWSAAGRATTSTAF